MIYLDNAAMTKPSRSVIELVKITMESLWFNPSSAYKYGGIVKDCIEHAKENVAKLIGADPSEIHFTSGATESANILLDSLIGKNAEVYITGVEHPCVANTGGYDVGLLPVDK